MYADTKCTLCVSGEEDSQYHLFNCQEIIDNCPALANNVNVEYEDIFGDISSQVLVAKLLSEILETRERLTEPD